MYRAKHTVRAQKMRAKYPQKYGAATPQNSGVATPQNHSAATPAQHKGIVRVVRGILVTLALALACSNLFLIAASAFGITNYLNWVPVALLEVTSDSMSPMFQSGDAVLVRQVSYDTLAVGDVVTFIENEAYVTHQIVGTADGGFTTRGIANLVEDVNLLTADNYAAKVVYVLPYLGYLMAYTSTPAVVAVCILLVLVVFYGRTVLLALGGLRLRTFTPRVLRQWFAQKHTMPRVSYLKASTVLALCSVCLCTHYVTAAKYLATINEYTTISAAYVHFDANYLSEAGNRYIINAWDGDTSGDEALTLTIRGISNNLLFNIKYPEYNIDGSKVTEEVEVITETDNGDGTTTKTTETVQQTVYQDTQDLYYYLIVEKVDSRINGATSNMIPFSAYTVSMTSESSVSEATFDADEEEPAFSSEWEALLYNTVTDANGETTRTRINTDTYTILGPYELPAAEKLEGEELTSVAAVADAKEGLLHSFSLEVKLNDATSDTYNDHYVHFKVYAVTSASNQFYTELTADFQYKKSDTDEFIAGTEIDKTSSFVYYTVSTSTETGNESQYVRFSWDPDEYFINNFENTAYDAITNKDGYYFAGVADGNTGTDDTGADAYIIVEMNPGAKVTLEFYIKSSYTNAVPMIDITATAYDTLAEAQNGVANTE